MSVSPAARLHTVAVCGSSKLPSAELEALAEELGAEIIRAGMNLVTGGLGGVMAATSRGAARARKLGEGPGIVIGILPGNERATANEWCDVVLPTGMGIARNLLVVRAADAVVVFRGGSGTLSEAAFAWQLGKPVVAFSTTGGWAAKMAGTALDDTRKDLVLQADTAEKAVSMVRRAITRSSTNG